VRHLALAVLLAALIAGPARAADGPTVRFDTSLGNIDVRLFEGDAPNTVATFLRYAAAGAYDSSYFHRSVRDFIIQGGGYRLVDGQTTPIGELIADSDPFKRSNQRGTLAIARRPGEPNRSTSQWFFNQADNTSLDQSSANYTVFGRVNDRASLAVMDAIGALRIIDGSGGQAGSAFGELPVMDYAGGTLANENLVVVRSVKLVPEPQPPYALPFKLRRSNLVVHKTKRQIRVAVRRVPAGTNVVARLRKAIAVAAAPAGTASLKLRRPSGKAKLKVTATPPGVKPSTVAIALK
jgi:cyclophilin family peptidyl-prolyl cis-trans isomerase